MIVASLAIFIIFPSAIIAPAQTAPAAAPVTTALASTSTTPSSFAIAQPAAASEPALFAKSPVKVSGLFDGYLDFDTDHPDDGDTQLRNFDIRANTVSLNEAKVVFSCNPTPFGFRADVGLGSVFEVMHPANPSGGGLKYVEQMFVSTKPPSWKGFRADFGQFASSAGAESIDSINNWSYSRSLLFTLATPYYHFGLRTSMPVTSTIKAGVQVVQGWNNIFDNNSNKTIGLILAQSKKYYTLNVNYYVGPENNHTDRGYRNLIDTTLMLTPTAKFNAYINYDYAQNRNPEATNGSKGSLAHWQGIAGAAHLKATSKITATVRAEYYSDNNGFTTGRIQALNEVTFTANYLIHPGILTRAEYRHDHSNQPSFEKNGIPSSVNGQSTFEISLIAFFGPKT